MAITHARSKLNMSTREDIDKFVVTLASGDSETIFPNNHSFHVLLFQIELTGTDTFSFSGSSDNTNFVPLRAWDILNELYTTSASVTTSGVFTVYCEGMRKVQIAKSGAGVPTIHASFHKDSDSHSVWTLHPFH